MTLPPVITVDGKPVDPSTLTPDQRAALDMIVMVPVSVELLDANGAVVTSMAVTLQPSVAASIVGVKLA